MFRMTLTAAVLGAGMAGALHAEMLKVHQVSEHVWALEGPPENRTPENLGNNATFGLIETSEGAVLIDTGGTYQGARAIDDVVATLTNQPVKFVISTGGQDHRWLGSGYWQEKGAKVIASEDAVADHEARGSQQMTGLSVLVGVEGLEGTEPSMPDITFEDSYDLTLGGTLIQLRHPHAAHTPGETFVWLEDTKTVFTGDIVYVGRMLGVIDVSASAEWIEAFEAFAALKPEHVVPGHGPATTLDVATADTYDYLVHLREKIAEHMDAGGDIIGSVKVDQSAFAYLAQFDALAGRNAQRVFEEMEWE